MILDRSIVNRLVRVLIKAFHVKDGGLISSCSFDIDARELIDLYRLPFSNQTNSRFILLNNTLEVVVAVRPRTIMIVPLEVCQEWSLVLDSFWLLP